MEDSTRRPDPAARVYRGVESNGGPQGAATGGPANGSPGSGDAPANGDGGIPVEGTGPRVSLERFEGPLDLLLFLIREEKVDITDIPIARITDQYLQTIGNLDELDLDDAGEYLVMATTLMRIKAKMLLPRDEDDEEEDEEDPRAELVRRLMEYREFKRIAEVLDGREEEWRGLFARAASPIPEIEDEDDGWLDPDVSLVDIFRAFRTVLAQAESDLPLHMETESFSVEEQMAFIRAECGRAREGVAFQDLFEGMLSRALLITTFLALLEMMRQREIVAHQVERFGEIWLRRATEEATTNE